MSHAMTRPSNRGKLGLYNFGSIIQSTKSINRIEKHEQILLLKHEAFRLLLLILVMLF